MKKTLTTIVGIIVLLFVAIAVLPSVINWNQYKDEITVKAKEATGRDVVIQGDINLRIFPSPSIVIHDIQLGNPDGFDSNVPFARLEKIEINAALKPLFKKQLHITGVSLVSPAIYLQTKGVKNNWDFSSAKTDKTKEAAPAKENAFTPELSFDEIAIDNGALVYSDGMQESKQVNPINAKLKGKSLKGPFTLSGSILYSDIPANFEVKISEIIENKPIAVEAAFSADKNNAVIQVAANVGGSDSGKTTAKVSLNINDLERLMASLKDGKAPALPPFLKEPIKATGDLTQTDTGTNLDNLQVVLGKLNVKGNATYGNDKKLGVSLATNTVDLRDGTKKPATDATATSNQTYQAMIDGAFQSASGLIGTPIPSGMTAGFELRIKQLITQDNIKLDDVEVSALIDDTTAKISKISVQLPGQASLALSATMPLKNQKIEQINGNIIFKATKTDAALAAFGVKDLPSGFSPMDAKASLKITQGSLALTDTVLKFGKNSLNGLYVGYTPKEAVPLQFKIKGGDLDFNTLTTKKADTESTPVQNKTSASLGLPVEVTKKLAGLKASLAIGLDQIISGQNLARNVKINSLIDGEKITLTEASIGDLGDLNSLKIKLSGTIGKLSPFDGLDLTINASSDNLSRTLWAFGNKNAGDIGKASLTATVKGNQESVALKAQGKIDQGQLSIDGTIKNLANNPSLTGQMNATHPETSVVLKNFANTKTGSNKMGPFSMATKLTASTGKFKTEELVVSMGTQGTIGGHINYDKTVTPGVIDIDLNADLLPLGSITGAKTNRIGGGTGATAAPKTWSQTPIDLSALRNTSGTIKVNVKKLTYDAFIFDDFALLADVKNGTLTLQKLGANMFDGSFAMTGALTAGQTGQSHKGQFNIDIANTNVEKVFSALGSKAFGGGILSYKQAIAFNGANQLGIIKSLNGKGNMIVENGSFNGLDLDSLATKMDRPNSPTDFLAILQQAKAGGTSTFEKIDAPISIENGVIKSNDIAVKSQKSQIDLGGFVDMPNQNLNLDGDISFIEQRNIPPLGLNISGPLYAPVKKFKTDNILRFYTQKATQELGQKALDKLFGTQKPDATTAPTTTTEPTIDGDGNTVAPVQQQQQPAEQAPLSPEDALKKQGEQLLRGLLGGQ